MKARHKDTGEIIELAEEGITSCDGRHFCWYQVELIPEPIDECEPSLPSNLDEVAKKIAYDVCKALPNGEEKDTVVYYAILTAMAGAKWMAEQGETKEGIVVDNNDFVDFEDNSFIDVCPTLDKKAFNLHDGEKVIVQIRKKEE